MLSNFKLRTRLYIGFFSLIAISLVLAGSGSWGIDRLGERITRLESMGANVERVLTARTLLENIRRAQLRYMLDGYAGAITDMQTAGSKAKDVLAAVAVNTLSAERLAIYNAVTARLAEQVAGAAKLVDLGKAANEGRARLSTDGDVLTAAVDRMMEPLAATHDEAIRSAATQAERALLLVLVNNWRFLATHDPAETGKFRAAADQAEKALEAAERVDDADMRPVIGPVRDALNTYSKDFGTVSEAILTQTALFGDTLNPLIMGMQDNLGKAEQTLLRDSAAISRETHETVSSITTTQVLLGSGGLIAGLIFAFFIARSILGPLTRMTAAMARLATGDHAAEIPARDATDEIGDMARAVEVFQRNGIAATRLAAEQEAERTAKEQRVVRLETLTRSFEARVGDLVGQVSSAATELQATARSMTGTAGDVTHQATNAATAAERASANVQTVAAAAEELASSITEISRQVAQSAKVAGKARDDAKRTDEVVQALAEGAQKIGEIVSLISNIAGQTNLLALNATIEAARAGDAGKGFAVVASEVKGLATQTAKATEDIARQITQIQTVTQQAVGSIRDIGTTIGEISEIAAGIAAAVEEQGAATQEIARNVQQAASGTQAVSSNVTGVSQGANDTGAAAGQVLGAAGELSRQAEQLRSEVGGYIAGVKAA